MNCFYQQALGRAQICLTVQQILGNSTEGNAKNLTEKIHVFFVAKHYIMELRQDRYLSMRRLSNLSSFENLSRSVIFRFTSISGVEGYEYYGCIY